MDCSELINVIKELKPSKDWWDYLVSAITAITGILTLLVALRLFNKFSFKRNVLEKQLETLFRFVNVLQNWTISIEGKGLEEEFPIIGFRIRFFDFKFKKTDPNYRILFIPEKLLFTYDWEEQNPLKGWENNPFLPKSIAEKVKPFNISFPYPAYKERFEKVILIDLDPFDGTVKREERGRTNYIHNPSDICCKDFESFHKLCNDLIDEIESWLRKYNAGDINLR